MDLTGDELRHYNVMLNYLYQTRENRIYDVNRVLEEARKNRRTADD